MYLARKSQKRDFRKLFPAQIEGIALYLEFLAWSKARHISKGTLDCVSSVFIHTKIEGRDFAITFTKEILKRDKPYMRKTMMPLLFKNTQIRVWETSSISQEHVSSYSGVLSVSIWTVILLLLFSCCFSVSCWIICPSIVLGWIFLILFSFDPIDALLSNLVRIHFFIITCFVVRELQCNFCSTI